MKKLTAILTLLTIATSTSVIAEQSLPENLENTDSTELSQVFDISQSEKIQALELSNQEMLDTQGAIIPFIPVAVAVGSRFITSQAVKHYVSSGSIAYGTYKASVQMSEK